MKTDEQQVEDLIKRGAEALNEKDYRTMYDMMSPNYRQRATYEEFQSYMSAGMGLVLLFTGPGKWAVSDISIRIEGDLAFARYKIRKAGEVLFRVQDTGNEDIYRKVGGKWYDVAEGAMSPGYNSEDLSPSRKQEPTPTTRTLPTTGAGTISIVNPRLSLSGTRVYEVGTAPHWPDGELFLVSGLEAIKLAGPEIARTGRIDIDSLFKLRDEGIRKADYGQLTVWDDEGYLVVVNPQLSFEVAIDDWEEEIALARVELRKTKEVIESSFTFLAEPSGGGRVRARMAALVNGNAVGMTKPVAIEVRERHEEGVIVPGAKPPSREDSIAWGRKVSAEFRARVIVIAKDIGADVDHLMAVIAFETGKTFDPAVTNPVSGAVGLIQFLPSTARGWGTTVDELRGMSAVQQLDYVEKYFLPYRGRLTTLEDVYMAVLWPRAIGQPNDYTLFSKPSAAYDQNRGLDLNGDGRVTKAEASAKVRDILTEGLQPGNQGAVVPAIKW